jgi:hypothetical protein
MSSLVKKVSVKGISVAVFENECTKGDQTFTKRSVSLQKSYKDKNGDWQNTSSIAAEDLPFAILALQQVFEWNYVKPEIDGIEDEF